MSFTGWQDSSGTMCSETKVGQVLSEINQYKWVNAWESGTASVSPSRVYVSNPDLPFKHYSQFTNCLQSGVGVEIIKTFYLYGIRLKTIKEIKHN